MTSRERVLRTLRHEQPDRVALGFSSTPEAMDNLKKYFNTEKQDVVLNKLGIDTRRVEPRYIGPDNLIYNQGLDKEGTDIFGIVWEFKSNNYGHYAEIVKSPLAEITDVEELERYPWPKVDWFDYKSIKEQINRINDKEEYSINFFGGKIFEIAWYMRGFEQTLVDLYENPHLFTKIMEKVYGFFKEFSKEIILEGNGRMDIVCTGDDIGTQRGMLISPEIWKEYIKPWHKRLNEYFHDNGLKVRYHSCGNIMPVIEELIDMGVDILNPLQFSAEGMLNPEELKKQYGDRLCFQGGIDVQHSLLEMSIDEIQKETRRIIGALGKGGGYIMEGTHNFQGDVPAEKIVAVYNEALKGY
jgi:uroporphyrinogen decarboxylase